MRQSRRSFLKASLGTSVTAFFGPSVPGFLSHPALAAEDTRGGSGTVLVVIQLAGGNDGLNTLVPYADDEYARRRTTLRLGEREVHKVSPLLGFHPRMQAFKRLHDEGHLTVVQGVGYPNSSRDHAEAMRAWHTGRPGEPACQTGWVGRTIDNAYDHEDANTPGAFVGQIGQPYALRAERAVVPSVRSAADLPVCAALGEKVARAQCDAIMRAAAHTRAAGGNPLLELVQSMSSDAYAMGERIRAAVRASGSGDGAGYPAFKLAQDLRTVSQLVRAEAGVRIYFTVLGGDGFGGFDNHANQRGNHGALLHELSESVAAFVRDLERDRLLDRVLLMTFSEFGRTVAENGRRGTGHGAAAAVFLAGGKLKGGLVGAHPSLVDLEEGAQKVHTDFRRLYATCLKQWLGFDSAAIVGEKFEPLGVLRA
jgi:uncharacterized protein (DUF1501 family)